MTSMTRIAAWVCDKEKFAATDLAITDRESTASQLPKGSPNV
jgi:hypothetical protein